MSMQVCIKKHLGAAALAIASQIHGHTMMRGCKRLQLVAPAEPRLWKAMQEQYQRFAGS